MFMLESYITPIILSYVDKYIKNFRPKDSQVSLWGGDASFHNLDLRLEVLEQELKLPFSFVSGHIRELLIHVPWTKLASEPITITINTIECTLKLRGSEPAASPESPFTSKDKPRKAIKQDIEAPPNYVQLLINKIVSNIRIYCNNVILKYVEEDIVLSMNVKLLKFESANEKWEAAYSDFGSAAVTLRKIITVNDLTLCLDKRNAAGKITCFQEPMLYRCSMNMRLLRHYHSASANRASTTRLDVFCPCMEFGMTEQQVPMVLRLMKLLYALQQRQLKPHTDEIAQNSNIPPELRENSEDSETWTSWAWSYVSSVLPAPWDEEWTSEDFNNQNGHTLQMGFYVEDLSVTFKVCESSSDQNFYSHHKKLKYLPLLVLELHGIYCETIRHGLQWFECNLGTVSMKLWSSKNDCSCGIDGSCDQSSFIGFGKDELIGEEYKKDSLFDERCVENLGRKREYSTSWENCILKSFSEEILMRRVGDGMAMSYVYQMEIPSEMTSDMLSELESNYEFSNLSERSSVRIFFGKSYLNICSGLIHRISTLKVAASYYDYPNYYEEKIDLPLQELLPPSEEDFEALCKFIPTRSVRITFLNPEVKLFLMDHPFFQPNKGHLYRKGKKLSNNSSKSKPGSNPYIQLKCKELDFQQENPMYINRLVHTTCQLPDIPPELYNACFTKQTITLTESTIDLQVPKNTWKILEPCNLTYDCRTILKPQYWTNADTPHKKIELHMENLTLITTKVMMLITKEIIENILLDSKKNFQQNSLLNDVSKNYSLPFLQLCMEGISCSKVTTCSTISCNFKLNSIKGFIYQGEQVVPFITSPEGDFEESSLLIINVQYPLSPDLQVHPAIVLFNVQETKLCVDPLLLQWLLYKPKTVLLNKYDSFEYSFGKSKVSEASGSQVEAPLRRMSGQIESVHSSSERDAQVYLTSNVVEVPEDTVDLQERVYNCLKSWFDVWKSMLLSGDVNKCTITFPVVSAKGRQDDLMIVTLPSVKIQSSQRVNLGKYLNKLPVVLPASVWSLDKSSFPWTMSLSDLTCSTIQSEDHKTFLSPLTLSATVGLSTRPTKDNSLETNLDTPLTPTKSDIGYLGVCVHVDMTPIVIATFESQVVLFAGILRGLFEVLQAFLPVPTKKVLPKTPEPTNSIYGKTGSSTLSPTILDSSSERTVSVSNLEGQEEGETIKLTAWIQCTVTRVTIKLLAQDNIKLVIDSEDIVSSLDFQNIYLKVKSKIGSLSIQHFKKTKHKWKPGPYSGIVMRQRDDISSLPRHEDNGFLSLTITRASCKHTHSLWGAVQKKNKQKKIDQMLSATRYITEIDVNVQPIDFVVSFNTLKGFYEVLKPLMQLGGGQSASKEEHFMLNNQTLPLAYLDCQNIRIIVPCNELNESATLHDSYVVQVDKISLSSSAENPICRTPCRPDIYEQAAQARILNVPGSEVEDRQYQLDIIGLSFNTGSWDEIDSVFSPSGSLVSTLRSMSENPAVEWNNLEQGQPNLIPNWNLWQITDKFQISVIAAPAMLYKDSIVICGNSMEVNFVTDINMNISLNQIKLASSLYQEFLLFCQPILREDLQEKSFYSESILSNQFEEEVLDGSFVLETIRDSGIDTSDVRSLSSRLQGSTLKLTPESERFNFSKPSNQIVPAPTCIPMEVLITAGGIFVVLYHVDTPKRNYTKQKSKKKKSNKKKSDDHGYEASEESFDEKSDTKNSYIPLMFASVVQPNAFYSRQSFGRKIQVSCFDVNLKLNSPEYVPVGHVPGQEDFLISFLETRSGAPHSTTGILPAFFTVRYTKSFVGKTSNLELNISKPIKINFSTLKWLNLQQVKDKIMDCLIIRKMELEEVKRESSNFREYLFGVTSLNLKLEQIVLALQSDSSEIQVEFGLEKLESSLNFFTRPEKLCNNTSIESVTITVVQEGLRKLFLNPWSFTVDLSLFWETWQSVDNGPQVQLILESNCICLDLSPEQIKSLEKVVVDLKELLPAKKEATVKVHNKEEKLEKDQHYKDDLRAGAFQFVDADSLPGTSEELPLPYQVIFWGQSKKAMAWKYPQPRALTKVRVFPVPYNSRSEDLQVLCALEYWSEARSSYLHFTQFYLSENEISYLDLPKSNPQPIVASIWRVVINSSSFNEDIALSPRALAACMRIDSYFNSALIPNLTAAIYVTKIEIALYSSLNKLHTKSFLNFTSDLLYPERQCFLTVTKENLTGFINSWKDFNKFLIQIQGSLKVVSLDYLFLTEEEFVEPVTLKLELIKAKELTVNLLSKPVKMRFSPGIAHTLSVSGQLWMQSTESDLIIITRYAICNNLNVNLRFGQNSTEEDLLLPPKYLHLYAWRSQKRKQLLRIALEENNWIWSQSFSIYEEGVQAVNLNGFVVFITVKSLSTTQKSVIFSGQLTISNLLLEHFAVKLVEAVQDNKDTALKNAPVHVVPGQSPNNSIVIKSKTKYFLRLRFYGLESAWTGDIPLRPHSNGAQPWLVKVPLQERGQFLSIWCRIVHQDFAGTRRILAMLWPLFTIRSNLPINTSVDIDTPSLNVHLQATIKGKGLIQQLYCPGTIDHSHQLTFNLENFNLNSNTFVPLNYSLVDQQKFFKQSNNEDIEDILNCLQGFYNRSKWPFFGEEDCEVDWIVDEQPLIHVQVRYQSACPYSSSLLVELNPWCLMANILGVQIVLLQGGVELCRLQHHGIVAPPKLEETFNLGLVQDEAICSSGPLQLAKSDWSKAFYMPKITGTIPLEGTVKTAIFCDLHVCMVSLTSSLHNEIRLLKISSSHTLSNHMNMQLQVVCFAVPDQGRLYDLPENLSKFCFVLPPHMQKIKSGIPIIKWLNIDKTSDLNNDFALYISLAIKPESGWSCPVRVDKIFLRKSFSIMFEDKSIPVVMTCQENKGQIYLALGNDNRPQIYLQNKTKKTLFCGQIQDESSGITAECDHFKWLCKVRGLNSVYYTMPSFGGKFPELPQQILGENLVLASSEKTKDLQWSNCINVTSDQEQFVRIPSFGDVRVCVFNAAATTIVTVEPVGQVEISARDIRVRLSMHEKENKPSTSHYNQTSNIEESYSSQNLNKIEEKSSSNDFKQLLAETLPEILRGNCLQLNCFVKSFTVALTTDFQEAQEEQIELVNFTLDNIALTAIQLESLTIKLSSSALQCDNQLYTRGCYDFPVVLIGQELHENQKLTSLNVPIEELLLESYAKSLITLELTFDTVLDQKLKTRLTAAKNVRITLNPISCFVEDIYLARLTDFLTKLSLDKLVLWPEPTINPRSPAGFQGCVVVPELIAWQCAILAKPLTVRSIVVNPIFLLLSVHGSVKLYIALDQSPLQFGRFERKRILTIPYRLGHAITMHYLSGAIFGAGWVVSSLELLGSPGGLARAMGSGLRDFIALPYRGLVQGPMAFLKGITHGSASLMKHVTAGTLQSVTKLASSVARNLDYLTLDEEHLKRTEEQRRQKPQGLAQGFMQGLTGLGISLLGAVGGIAHHPLQSLMADGASPRSLATGIGLGMVGVITKPLSGAAELVALTGQGLLQGAGWNSLPEARSAPQTVNFNSRTNSPLKYSWKWLQGNSILFVTEATTSHYEPVALILTTQALIILKVEEDRTERIIGLNELQIVQNTTDPTLLSFRVQTIIPVQVKTDEECLEMDPVSRARVADYVRSTVGLLNLPPDESAEHSEISISPLGSPSATPLLEPEIFLSYFVSPQQRNYFLCLLRHAKQQQHNYNFAVL